MAGVIAFRATGDEGSRGPGGFDAKVAAPARVYDYWLGGKDNFAADRIAGEAAIDAYPAIRFSARANRAFLMRTVSYLARERGIRQFLDIGAGLPAWPNTHEIAQSIAPHSRIVYVDNDPMVLSHARALLSGTPHGITAYVDADLRDTAAVLTRAAQALDFTRPVAILLLAVLDHIPGLDQARRIVARLLAAAPPGSFLVISHAASDIDPDETAEMIGRLNEHLAEGSFTGRPRDVVARFFDGLDPVAPGIVKVTQWHPRSELEARGPASLWGGVACKPQTCRRAGPTRKPGPHSRPGPGPRGDDDPAPRQPAGPGLHVCDIASPAAARAGHSRTTSPSGSDLDEIERRVGEGVVAPDRGTSRPARRRLCRSGRGLAG